MYERLTWLTTPIVLVSGGRYFPSRDGGALPRATADTYAALREAAPLTLEEVSCILVGLHPCLPEDGDDPALVDHGRRVLVRLESDFARGEISNHLTLHEAVAWAKRVGLPVPSELAARGADGVTPPPDCKSLGDPRWASTRAGGIADFDPELDAKGRLVAEELKAQGKKVVKKSVARELKRRFNLDQDEGAIIRRIRAYR